MFGIQIILWKAIKKYDDDKMHNNRILLKTPEERIIEGWFMDGGWYRNSDADHLKEHITPAPTHFYIVNSEVKK